MPFTPAQMYALVNDVESYPLFLPWCREAKLLSSDVDRLEASLTLAAGKIHQTFSTANSMVPGRSIVIRLLDGPFKYMNGNWQFDPEGEKSCRITLRMEFEFKNRLMKLALDKMFGHVVNTLIDAFTQRAYQVHGGG